MSQDVDEAHPLARRRSSTTGDLGTSSILRSKIKSLNSLAMNSLGNLFSGHSSTRSSAYMRHSHSADVSRDLGSGITVSRLECELEVTRTSDIDEGLNDDSAVYPTGQYCNLRAEDYSATKALDRFSVSPDPGTKQATTAEGDEDYSFVQDALSTTSTHTTPMFPEVRRMFNSLSRSAKEKSGLIHSDTQQSLSSLGSPTGIIETPPLTPDSAVLGLPSPALSLDRFDSSLGLDEFCVAGLHGDSETRTESDEQPLAHLQEIKEGKKPAKPEPVLYDAPELEGTGSQTPATPSDQSEWFGLEYTLQVSSRERQPSLECGQPATTIGEHSRSRESWAAIHRGTIHPLFEDEGYIQWKNWHRFLDKQDEKRRHRKGALFKTQARELAWLYVDEMRTREMMYWQKEVYGVVARDVKEKLQYLSEKRPDPFYPARKHNLAWYLKRSRSVGSLRELKGEEFDS